MAILNKKITESEVLDFLVEYLVMSLDELTDTTKRSEFADGEITAFVECLEILSGWEPFDKFGIGDIEKKYHVK